MKGLREASAPAESRGLRNVSHFVAYEMEAAGQPVRRVVRPKRRLEPDEVLVRVAGCGVCHTDVGFLYGGVRTRHAPPLILGHEISGHIEDAGSNAAERVGQAVVVPAVLPCRSCDLCQGGHPTICRAQVMPGNDCDGGFATHVVLPGRDLCRVPGADGDADASDLGAVNSAGEIVRAAGGRSRPSARRLRLAHFADAPKDSAARIR